MTQLNNHSFDENLVGDAGTLNEHFTTYRESAQPELTEPVKTPESQEVKTTEDFLIWGSKQLKELGSGEAQINAERILEEVSGIGRMDLHMHPKEILPRKVIESYKSLIARRKERVPLAHLFGKASFWNEELKVNPECLIPRPETEILVERIIETARLEKKSHATVLDLGTGSGAIGIALLRTFPHLEATFSDVSESALGVAKENLRHYDLMSRAHVVHSDLFNALEGMKWDLIVSNPPYIAKRELVLLEPEVLQDPKLALEGGEDGLDFYRLIISEASSHLKAKGKLAFEVGKDQANSVRALLEKQNFKSIKVYKDYAGIDRVVIAQKA